MGGIDLSSWNVKAEEKPKTTVDVQHTWAIVDDLGRPCSAQAVLFSPQIALFPQDGELMNVTLFSTEEIARRILAAAQNNQDFHVTTYQP